MNLSRVVGMGLPRVYLLEWRGYGAIRGQVLGVDFPCPAPLPPMCYSPIMSGKDSADVRSAAFYVYILRTSSNTLYIGQTSDLDRRLEEHKSNKAKSAKYLRYFDSFKLVYSEKYPTRTEALRREAQLKKWPRAKKLALIEGNLW